jgi:hypothetical protein
MKIEDKLLIIFFILLFLNAILISVWKHEIWASLGWFNALLYYLLYQSEKYEKK